MPYIFFGGNSASFNFCFNVSAHASYLDPPNVRRCAEEVLQIQCDFSFARRPEFRHGI